MELDEALEQWLHEVQQVTDLSVKDKAKITGAGAKVFEEKLKQDTKAKHYSSHKDETYGHMADNVDSIKTNVDRVKDGSSTVGWNNPYHASNARRLNDGTKSRPGDHWVTNLRSEAFPEVVEAEKLAYEELIKKKQKKGGGEK